MKRFSPLLMLIALLLILSACSSSDAGNEGDKGKNEKVTLEVMFLKESGTKDHKAEWMHQNIELFKKDHPEVNFEIVDNTGGDNYLTAVTTRMAANDVPDVIETWTLERLRPFTEADRLYDLTEFLDETDLKSKFSAEALNATSFGGKTYAIPLTQDLEIVYYNKEVFENNNLAVPNTYEELLHIIEVLKAVDIIPITLPNKEAWMGTIPYMMIAERIGGMDIYNETVLDKSGSWTNPVFIEAAEKIQELMELGAFEKNVNSLTRPESELKLAEGKAGMHIGLTAAANGNLMEQMGENLGFFNFPDIEGGKGSKDHYLITPTIGYAASKSTKHPEVVKQFLSFIYSNERQLELAKTGTTVAYNLETEPGDLPKLNEDLAKASSNATASMYFWDMPLGSFMGQELNNTTQSIYMGVDPLKAFEALQKSAESPEAKATE